MPFCRLQPNLSNNFSLTKIIIKFHTACSLVVVGELKNFSENHTKFPLNKRSF